MDFELDSGGLWWAVNRVHSIQKVRGSNPLGSTEFASSEWPVGGQACRSQHGAGRPRLGAGDIKSARDGFGVALSQRDDLVYQQRQLQLP